MGTIEIEIGYRLAAVIIIALSIWRSCFHGD